MITRPELAEQLLGVLDGAPEPLVVVGRDWTYLYANDAARDLLGMEGDVVGLATRAVHPRLSGTPLAAAAKRVMQGGPAEVVDQHYRSLGVDLRARVIPIPDGVALVLRDVTDKTRPSYRLLRDAALYQQVLDHATAAITLFDLDDRFLLLNRAAVDMIGQSLQDLVGRSMTDVFGEEVGQQLAAVHAEARRVGSAVEVRGVESWERERGREVLAEVFPVYSATSELVGTGAVVTDVSGPLAAERELVAAQERYRAVFAGATLALLVVRPRGLIVEANAAACKLLGYSRAQLLRMTGQDLVGGDRATLARWRARMLAEGQLGFEDEAEYVRSDGSRVPVLVTVKVFEDPAGGELVSLVVRDQSRLKELQSQLVRSERMEAAGRLAAGVAHDANNILAAVQGYAQLLSLEIDDDATAQRHLAGIFRSVERAGDMVSQLLAFTRGQELAAAAVDLADVVAEQEDMLRRLLPQEISLRLDLDPAPTCADASQLGRVLLNLVVNARDAVDGSGTICVRTCSEVIDADDVLQPGSYAVLSVADDGRGMDATVAARCFEPFFTTRPVGSGTGLGLSMAHGVARQSGGDLRVRTAPGEGAEFRLLLPAAAPGVERRPEAGAVSERPAVRVLVVDDDTASRYLVRALLRRNGYRVVEAGDGQEALAVAATASGVDLVVSDLQMPHLDGEALAAALRETNPGLPFVLISGAANAPPGWDEPFLHKPFSEQELLAAVTSALARRPA